MKQDNPFTIWRYLTSRYGLQNIVLPIVIYNVVYYILGLDYAIAATLLFFVIVIIFNKSKNSIMAISIMILFDGIISLIYKYNTDLIPIHNKEVFFSLSGALTTVIVFSFYSLIKKPILPTLTEQAIPRLKTISVYGKPIYHHVWNEVTMVWIIGYFLKAVIIYCWYQFNLPYLNSLIILASGPLLLAMIIFSFKWPKYRWHSAKKSESINE